RSTGDLQRIRATPRMQHIGGNDIKAVADTRIPYRRADLGRGRATTGRNKIIQLLTEQREVKIHRGIMRQRGEDRLRCLGKKTKRIKLIRSGECPRDGETASGSDVPEIVELTPGVIRFLLCDGRTEHWDDTPLNAQRAVAVCTAPINGECIISVEY